jgi:hypothetical protein
MQVLIDWRVSFSPAYKLHKHKKKFPIAPVAPGDFCSTYTTTREKADRRKQGSESLSHESR